MAEALAPCPFCQHPGAAYVGAIRRGFAVTCSLGFGGCGATSGIYDTEAIATAAWNRRPAPPPTDDGGAAMAAAVSALDAAICDSCAVPDYAELSAEQDAADRVSAARARVLALHAAAVAEAEARGRAAALAEVDAAIDFVNGTHDDSAGIGGVYYTDTTIQRASTPRPGGGGASDLAVAWAVIGPGGYCHPLTDAPTPTAALLAAAATLAPAAEEADDDDA